MRSDGSRSVSAVQDPQRRRAPFREGGRIKPCPRLLCAAVLGLSLGLAGMAREVPEEYRLKAAFVYRFPQFVDWPEPALQDRATIDLCVLAPSPFGTVLDELAAGERVGDRPLAVLQVGDAAAAAHCHVLYVTNRGAARRAMLRQLADLPVLTVGDGSGFLDDGGMVLLRLVEGRVRFEINMRAADKAGLRISAQLLRLALDVREGPS